MRGTRLGGWGARMMWQSWCSSWRIAAARASSPDRWAGLGGMRCWVLQALAEGASRGAYQPDQALLSPRQLAVGGTAAANLGHGETCGQQCLRHAALAPNAQSMPQEFVVDGGVSKKMVYPEEEPAGAAGAAADAGAAGAQAAAAEQVAAAAEQAAAGAEAVEEEEERPPIQWPETI